MFLRWLSYFCRYGDMIYRFVKLVFVISMVINNLIDYIFDVYGWWLIYWNFEILDFDYFEMYVVVIMVRGLFLYNCFGFIDGIVRLIVWLGDN